MEWIEGEYRVTDEKAALDMDFVAESLAGTYWGEGRAREVTERAFANSVVLTLLAGDEQAGMARIVGDGATFAWICDVFVEEGRRGRGLGKWLMRCALEHSSTHVARIMLRTRDAQGLYERYGFTVQECMSRTGEDL